MCETNQRLGSRGGALVASVVQYWPFALYRDLGRSPPDRVRRRAQRDGPSFGGQSKERTVTKSLTQNTIAVRAKSTLRTGQ